MNATRLEKYRVGGTRRICAPAETLARVQPLLQRCGITRVANVTALDHVGIPVVMVVRPNGASLSVAQGKGTDLAAAKASGVMEAIEHHYAEVFAPKNLRLATMREITSESGIADVLWPSGAEPRAPRQKHVWIESTTRSGGAAPWVPFELVHLDLTSDHPLSHHAFPVSSSGLASGNTWNEALLHGACELIERDAMTLFYMLPPAQQHERRLDLGTDCGDVALELLARLERAALRVACWDMTTDVNVAAVLCAVLERDSDASRRNGVAVGAGCHPERQVALVRALCEAAQSRLTRIAGSRDDLAPDVLQSVRSSSSEERWQALMAAPPSMRPLSAVPDWANDTFDADLDCIEQSLSACGGGPLLAVPLSTAADPISVVRVLVPGLEAYSELPDYAPGPRARAHQARFR